MALPRPPRSPLRASLQRSSSALHASSPRCLPLLVSRRVSQTRGNKLAIDQDPCRGLKMERCEKYAGLRCTSTPLPTDVLGCGQGSRRGGNGVRNPGRGVKAAIAALAVTGVILAVSDAGAQQSSNDFPVGVD